MDFSWTERFLPNDPKKRDLAILAYIAVPLVIVGLLWATFGADPIDSIHFPDATPTVTATPAA